MSLLTSLPATYRYFMVADLPLDRETHLPRPRGKIARTGIFVDTVNTHFGYVWGERLYDDELLEAIAAAFVEEGLEIQSAWLAMGMPDPTDDEAAEHARLVRNLAEEYADLKDRYDLARRCLPDAPLEGVIDRNPALVTARWSIICNQFRAGQVAEARTTMSNYLATTLATWQRFMQRQDNAGAWAIVPEVAAEKARLKGISEGWVLKAMALPDDDPLAGALAANAGWLERPASEAPPLDTALDLPQVMHHSTLTAQR